MGQLAKQTKVRVGVLSANAFSTSAIIQEIRSHRDFQLIGSGQTVEELIQVIDGVPLDTLVMDTLFESSSASEFHPVNPIGLLREVYAKLPRTQVVCVLESSRSVHITALMRMNVSGVIIKTPDCTREIALALRYVQRGSLYLCNTARAHLLSSPLLPDLTEREIEIALYLHQNQMNGDIVRANIAQTLSIAEGTVKVHLSSLREKLGAHNDLEIAAACQRIGIVV